MSASVSFGLCQCHLGYQIQPHLSVTQAVRRTGHPFPIMGKREVLTNGELTQAFIQTLNERDD